MKENSSQIEVYFIPFNEQSRIYTLPSSDSYLISASFKRKDLSELLNALLTLEKQVIFDFLIDGEFLRTSIQDYLYKNELTTETSITIHYIEASLPPSTYEISNSKDWISSISSPISSDISIVGCYDGTISIYKSDINNNIQKLFTQQICDESITSISSFNDNSYIGLIITTDTKNAYFCYFKNEEENYNISTLFNAIGHSNGIISSACTPDGSTVVTSGWGSQLLIWDNFLILEDILNDNTSKNLKKRANPVEVVNPKFKCSGFNSSNSPITDVIIPAIYNNHFIISSSQDNTLYTHDILTGQLVCQWPLQKTIWSLSSCPTNTLFSTVDSNSQIDIWDIREPNYTESTHNIQNLRNSRCYLQQTYPSTSPKDKPGFSRCVKWNPHSEYLLASAMYEGCLKIFDIRSKEIALHKIQINENVKLQSCCWTSTSSLLSGGSDGVLRSHTF